MKGFRRRAFDLEAQLRAGRATPRPDFVRALAERVREDAKPVRRRSLRIAFAGMLTVAMLAALASVGALGHAASAVKQVARTVQAAVVSPPEEPIAVRGLSAGGDQYRPGYAFGDPDQTHTGPPGLLRQGGVDAPPLTARILRRRACSLVSTRILIDEQADLRVSVLAADGTRLDLTQARSYVGGRVSGPRTKVIRYRLLVPRVIRLRLCIPPALLEAGEPYTILFTATDPDGETSTLRIPLRVLGVFQPPITG